MMNTETIQHLITKSEPCLIYNLGLVEYARALKLQDEIVKERIAYGGSDVVLLLQHPPVLTIGASGGERNIIVPRDTLAEHGISICRTDRGGNITYHGPGQLVVYPILDLKTRGKDLHRYVRNLEEVVIRTLSDFSLQAHRISGYAGVWVGQAEVCAIGIKVTRWITKHGLAININNDMRYFSFIHPCGIPDKEVTSMSRLLGHQVAIGDVTPHIVSHFSEVFNLTVKQQPAEEIASGHAR
jgi:lipoate-protein ligase B